MKCIKVPFKAADYIQRDYQVWKRHLTLSRMFCQNCLLATSTKDKKGRAVCEEGYGCKRVKPKDDPAPKGVVKRTQPPSREELLDMFEEHQFGLKKTIVALGIGYSTMLDLLIRMNLLDTLKERSRNACFRHSSSSDSTPSQSRS
jgi:hypothetical protein